jgi:hypothetical protein
MSNQLSVADILSGIQGVWEGTYAHHNPDGSLIEKYACRQETRLIGDDWYERIIYLREGQEPEILDFRAKVIGDEVFFEDDNFVGRTYVAGNDTLIFPYHWKDNPGRTILEAIHILNEGYRTRLWQSFERGALVKLTIEERRIPTDSPKYNVVEWF